MIEDAARDRERNELEPTRERMMDATKNALEVRLANLEWMIRDVEVRLANLEWMIRDAKTKVVRYSEEVARRAQQASEEAKAITSNQPYSLSWINFMESDLQAVKDAEAALAVLIREEKVLRFILRAE